MASMVARACSSSSQVSPVISVQEKGSRNKRKFRADPSLTDSNDKILSSPHSEYTSFEFSAEKYEVIPSVGNLNGCDMCDINQDNSDSLKLGIGLSCAVGSYDMVPSQPREEIEATDEFHDADWSDLTESYLEELVLSNLDAIFKSAIRKIVSFGYSEEVASKAVLMSGICYGCKDTVSNIVDNTLEYLRDGVEIDLTKEHYFEDLQQMEKYILAELVYVLREVRPFFSTGDAMWCLLICDMNVSHACAMDGDPFNGEVGDVADIGNSSGSVHSQLRPGAKSSELNLFDSCNCIPPVVSPGLYSSDTPTTAEGHCSNDPQSNGLFMEDASNLKATASFKHNGFTPGKECTSSILKSSDKFFSAAGISQCVDKTEKLDASRKNYGIAKKEYILKHKTVHVEKHYRTYGSKRASRSGKINSIGGLIWDKKLKSVSGSSVVTARNSSLKVSKARGIDVPQENVNLNFTTNIGQPPPSLFSLQTVSASSVLPKTNIPATVTLSNHTPAVSAADTELSLALPAKVSSCPVPISCNSVVPNYSNAGIPCDSDNGILYDNPFGQWAPQDMKDKIILKLVPRVRELQSQLQEWTEWANQKVMQAARRLSKDKTELKTLRQEKEEAGRLKKEKQASEENTLKKLSEMKNALSKASGQVDRANAAVRKLEVENATLRQEMEAVKLRAAESAASCQELSRREKKTLRKFQSWEKQRTMFQEELVAEKRKLAELQKELEHAKDIRDQLEARWKQEEKLKEEFLTQASLLTKEREQIEALAKSKEDMIKLKAENNLQKYKDDAEKLEKQISELRFKSDSSKIASLKRGIDRTYVNRLTDFSNAAAPTETQKTDISRMVTEFRDYSINGGVKREWECVMCLSEEISVVFLPCAHQVVCKTCNELHEKQGMKDCPSCRSTIQRRICVRYGRSYIEN